MSWFNKWILALLPPVLLALRINLESSDDARKTQRGICIGIAKTARAIEMITRTDLFRRWQILS